MLRTDLEADLRERRTEDGFLFPAYEDYCFSNVPDTVRRVLAPDGIGIEIEPIPTRVVPSRTTFSAAAGARPPTSTASSSS